MASFEQLLAQGYGNVVKGGESITSPSYMAGAPVPVANVAPTSDVLSQATGLVANAATQMPDYFGQGVGALQGAQSAIGNAMATTAQTTGAYDPQSYQQFMNPYQSEVIDEYTKEMQRQFDISGQGRAAQAIGAGAFGGGREGVVEAEAQRGFQDQLGKGISGLLASGYQSAQQQAQQTFQNQQAARQAAAGLQLAGGELGQGIGQMYGTFGVQAPGATGQLATTLSQLGVTEQQAQQAQFNQEQANQMARFMQPYQALQFQSGLVSQFPTLPALPQSMGNPLLAGIGGFFGGS
tara:strand:+ start:1382 stop:2263 length:882 start_codon:yes stop_codon:yes gene_type:complete